MMIAMENQDNISSIPMQIKRDDQDDVVEEPPRKKMLLNPAINTAKPTTENSVSSADVISQQSAESIQKSPLESDFRDPVLVERLKGTIRLRLQSTISQTMKGLLNTMCASMEEGNRLKKVNSELQRRIKRLEKITEKVEVIVSERIPSVQAHSQNGPFVINPVVQIIEGSPGRLILNSGSGVLSTEEFSQVSCDVAASSAPPVAPSLDFEVAPLPDLDRQNPYPHLPILPVQPPLKIDIDESSEQRVKLKFDADQPNYPCEPAVSYELFSYASSDVDPRFGLTSSVWQRVGAVDALPLPMSCSLGYLQPGNVYHFAVYSIDRYQRASEWSNVASVPIGEGPVIPVAPSLPGL